MKLGEKVSFTLQGRKIEALVWSAAPNPGEWWVVDGTDYYLYKGSRQKKTRWVNPNAKPKKKPSVGKVDVIAQLVVDLGETLIHWYKDCPWVVGDSRQRLSFERWEKDSLEAAKDEGCVVCRYYDRKNKTV